MSISVIMLAMYLVMGLYFIILSAIWTVKENGIIIKLFIVIVSLIAAIISIAYFFNTLFNLAQYS